jgi:hypothetical protein
MKNLFNSVIRGFGTTLGRNAANSITNKGANGKVIRYSNSLTFWQGSK